MSQSTANLSDRYCNLYDSCLPNNDVECSLTARAIPAPPVGTWNQRFLVNLWKAGLMLTTHSAYTLMGDMRYPGGIPIRAPRPHDDDPKLWPPETWVVFRD